MYHCLLTPLFLLLFAATACAWDVITLGTSDDQDSPSSLATNQLLTECFHRLEYKLNILPRPSKRSIFQANHGEVDGDFSRTDAVAAVYPNIIKVPEHLAFETLTAFSTDPDLKVNGWDSLLSHHVTWVDGREICKSRLGHASKTTLERNEVALMKFLSENRAQVGVLGLKKGHALLLRLNITNVHPLSPPLENAKLYLYLHKKHAAIVPKVTAMLRTLKENGTYKAIQEHFFEGTPYPEGLLLTAQP